MVNYYIVHYWSGFNKMRCLVVAATPDAAQSLFFKAHPNLRPYNLIKVVPSTGRVYQLAG